MSNPGKWHTQSESLEGRSTPSRVVWCQRAKAVVAEGREEQGLVEQLHVDLHGRRDDRDSVFCPPCNERASLVQLVLGGGGPGCRSVLTMVRGCGCETEAACGTVNVTFRVSVTWSGRKGGEEGVGPGRCRPCRGPIPMSPGPGLPAWCL